MDKVPKLDRKFDSNSCPNRALPEGVVAAIREAYESLFNLYVDYFQGECEWDLQSTPDRIFRELGLLDEDGMLVEEDKMPSALTLRQLGQAFGRFKTELVAAGVDEEKKNELWKVLANCVMQIREIIGGPANIRVAKKGDDVKGTLCITVDEHGEVEVEFEIDRGYVVQDRGLRHVRLLGKARGHCSVDTNDSCGVSGDLNRDLLSKSPGAPAHAARYLKTQWSIAFAYCGDSLKIPCELKFKGYDGFYYVTFDVEKITEALIRAGQWEDLSM